MIEVNASKINRNLHELRNILFSIIGLQYIV